MTNWNDLTELERKCYECFSMSGHLFDHYDPNAYSSWCEFPAWVDEFSQYMDCDMKQVKGVLSSLVKKGLIKKTYYDDDFWWYNFTEDGYQLLKHAL